MYKESNIGYEPLEGAEAYATIFKEMGIDHLIPPFNEVKTGKTAPLPESFGPVLQNIEIDGQKCDIYHSNIDSNKMAKKETLGAILYIHQKNEEETGF